MPPITPAPWVVNQTDLAKYKEMHKVADTDLDGFVNGAEIKEIFLQSGLSQAHLAHIWYQIIGNYYILKYIFFVHAFKKN